MASQEAFKALLDLLPQIFVAQDEMRGWLATSVPDGDRITGSLPSSQVSRAQFFYATADILRRWGLLGVPEFWDPLAAATPTFLRAQVADLRGQFGVPPNRSGATKSTAPGAPSQPAPQTITVLLVSASPDSRIRLRVDTEFRSIIQRMRSTELRDRLNFVQLQAARFDDLRSALLQHLPHILHLSCHGAADGSLLFEPDENSDGRVAKSKLLKLLKALRDNLRLVVINACDSLAVARDIPPLVDTAVGMSDEVQDSEAIEFAVSFYEALGYGRSVENAFEVATVTFDEDIQQLFPSTDDDPGKKRQMTLVQG